MCHMKRYARVEVRARLHDGGVDQADRILRRRRTRRFQRTAVRQLHRRRGRAVLRRALHHAPGRSGSMVSQPAFAWHRTARPDKRRSVYAPHQLIIPHSTLNIQHSTFNPQHSTFNPQHSTFKKLCSSVPDTSYSCLLPSSSSRRQDALRRRIQP